MTTNEHLSMFELDLYFAASSPDARIDDHVSACERCNTYLSRLAVLQAGAPLPTRQPGAPLPTRQPGAPLPTRKPGAALPAPPEASRRLRSGRARIARDLTWIAALAVLGTLVVLLAQTPDADAPAVAVKGSPAVQLLVRRGEETRRWDGAGRLRAGDRLGLRVACEGFRRVAVAVAVPAESEGWLSLSEGACPATGAALPFTLVVDDAPGRERLAVVFSASTLDAGALGEAIERRRLDDGAWVTSFEFDKEAAR